MGVTVLTSLFGVRYYPVLAGWQIQLSSSGRIVKISIRYIPTITLANVNVEGDQDLTRVAVKCMLQHFLNNIKCVIFNSIR